MTATTGVRGDDAFTATAGRATRAAARRSAFTALRMDVCRCRVGRNVEAFAEAITYTSERGSATATGALTTAGTADGRFTDVTASVPPTPTPATRTAMAGSCQLKVRRGLSGTSQLRIRMRGSMSRACEIDTRFPR